MLKDLYKQEDADIRRLTEISKRLRFTQSTFAGVGGLISALSLIERFAKFQRKSWGSLPDSIVSIVCFTASFFTGQRAKKIEEKVEVLRLDKTPNPPTDEALNNGAYDHNGNNQQLLYVESLKRTANTAELRSR